jgi:K+ transporter
MPRWQDRLLIMLARSANDATDYFQIPTDRVVEVAPRSMYLSPSPSPREHVG